jgi:hypothetical protein
MILYPLKSSPIECTILYSYSHITSLYEIPFPYPYPSCSIRRFLYNKPLEFTISPTSLPQDRVSDLICLSNIMLCRTFLSDEPFSENEPLLFIYTEKKAYQNRLIIVMDGVVLSMNQMRQLVNEWFAPFKSGEKRIGICDLDKTLGVSYDDVSYYLKYYFMKDFSISGRLTYTDNIFITEIQLRNDVHEFLHEAKRRNMELYIITAGDICYARQFVGVANSRHWCGKETYQGEVTIPIERIISVRSSPIHVNQKLFSNVIPFFLLEQIVIPLWAVDDQIRTWNSEDREYVRSIAEFVPYNHRKQLLDSLDR